MSSEPAINVEPSDSAGRWKIRLLYIVSITIAFWFIDHDLKSAEDYEFRNEYRGIHNRTADRVENINQYSTLARMALGGFAVACLLVVPNSAKLRWKSPLLILFAAWVIFNFSSTLWSVNPKVTVLKLGSLFFFLVAAVSIARRLELHEQAIVFSGVCAIYILIGFLVEIRAGTFEPLSNDFRFVGTCHPNILGGYGSVCCLAAPSFSHGRKRIGFWTIAFFSLGILALVLTKSRTSLFGLVFALAAIRSITLRPGTRFIALACMTILAIVLAGYFAMSGGKTKSSVGNVAAMGRTEDMGSLTGRLPLWEQLLKSVEEHPILGHGYLAFWDKDRVETLSQILNWEIPHGHNMYIDVLIDGGVVGLGLFLTIILTGLVISFRRYFQYRDIGVAFVFGLTLFVIVHGIGESLFKLHTFLSLIFFTSLIRLGSMPPDSQETSNDDLANQ